MDKPPSEPEADALRDLGAMRRDYSSRALRQADLRKDPVEQFGLWFDEACRAQITDPNAMSLATAGADGRPSIRTVLLKACDSRGFVFYTNLESRKSRQLAENPNAALLFPWLDLFRQVSILGVAEKLSTAEAFAYFTTRGIGSQLAAWASPQSRVLTSRQMLETAWESMKRKFAGGAVPLPPFWGGYRVRPLEFEFWQGQTNRLHDRFRYTRQPDDSWKIERLAP